MSPFLIKKIEMFIAVSANCAKMQNIKKQKTMRVAFEKRAGATIQDVNERLLFFLEFTQIMNRITILKKYV